MAQIDNFRTVHLDQRGSSHTSDWLYYTERGGTEDGDSIKIELVSWPSFQPYGDVVETPGNVGLAAADDNITVLLRNKWGIERERSIMIGVLVDQ